MGLDAWHGLLRQVHVPLYSYLRAISDRKRPVQIVEKSDQELRLKLHNFHDFNGFDQFRFE